MSDDLLASEFPQKNVRFTGGFRLKTKDFASFRQISSELGGFRRQTAVTDGDLRVFSSEIVRIMVLSRFRKKSSEIARIVLVFSDFV